MNIGMYNSKEVKEGIFKKHGKSEKDTGSAEGQIALFT
ncbi:MAG: 30S ribosomal protein S15, partial [Flavobacteriaceae bacterium]